jgi:hypothetical protein
MGDKSGVELGAAAGRGVMPDWYGELLESVAGRISAGRAGAVLAANREAIQHGSSRDVLELHRTERDSV